MEVTRDTFRSSMTSIQVTKKLEEAFHELEKSFTRQQKREMKKRKFAFLSKDQLQKLYEKQVRSLRNIFSALPSSLENT